MFSAIVVLFGGAFWQERVLGAQEHVVGVINSRSSLGRVQVSCHHCFMVWGHGSRLCCIVWLLSKFAWFKRAKLALMPSDLFCSRNRASLHVSEFSRYFPECHASYCGLSEPCTVSSLMYSSLVECRANCLILLLYYSTTVCQLGMLPLPPGAGCSALSDPDTARADEIQL